MVNEPTQFIASLERHFALLRELDAEMIEARAALVSMNIEEIYEHNARQTDLCGRLRVEEANLEHAEGAGSPVGEASTAAKDLRGWLESLDAETSQRIRRMLCELAAAADEIREKNRVQTRLIQGTRRTLHVLGNAYASFAPTYSMPASPNHTPDARVQP